MTAVVELAQRLDEILRAHDPGAPGATADELRSLWLQYEPRSIDVIKQSCATSRRRSAFRQPCSRTSARVSASWPGDA